MKKRFFTLFLAVLLCVATVIPACSLSDIPRLVDDALLLSDSEIADLNMKLDEISERQQFDVVIATVDTLDGKTPQAYADDYFDYNGFGYGSSYDGVLLLVSMEDRDWYISTSGYGITAFTDAGIEYIGEQILSDLSNGYYYDAFNTFSQLSDEFVTQAKNGNPFDTTSIPKQKFDVLSSLVSSVGIGLVVSALVCLVLAMQLKSVKQQSAASNYIKRGSMNITDSREYFLYSNVSKQVKAKSSSGGSSTHRSSSGRSHGGGGGKF